MKVREFIKQEIDIDVYDNVCEELGIAFCGTLKLTDEGNKHFADALDLDIEVAEPVTDRYGNVIDYGCAIVDVDGEEGVWQKKLKTAIEFFHAAAGDCADTDYERWFEDE